MLMWNEVEGKGTQLSTKKIARNKTQVFCINDAFWYIYAFIDALVVTIQNMIMQFKSPLN